jgi:phosphoglycerate dehydrogenase-like enzyme
MKLLINSPFPLSPDQRNRLEQAAPELQVVEQYVANPDDLCGEGVVALVTELVPRDLAKWKDLRWVQLISAGSNHLLSHPIRDSSIMVTNASGTHAVPIAQYVTCAILMAAHRMPQLLEFKPSRCWPDRSALAGSTVRGRTVGILGYGSIGRECARQLAALGMRVLCLKNQPEARADAGYNPWPGTGDPDGTLPEAWFGPGQLAELLPQCDYVVVTVPATPATAGLIGVRELAVMKPSAHLVLISRGGIVDEAALSDALRHYRLAGATLDCFAVEPTPPNYPLFQVPNLVMTPHMSGVFDDFGDVFHGLVEVNLHRFCNSRPLLNRVDWNHGY